MYPISAQRPWFSEESEECPIPSGHQLSFEIRSIAEFFRIVQEKKMGQLIRKIRPVMVSRPAGPQEPATSPTNRQKADTKYQ